MQCEHIVLKKEQYLSLVPELSDKMLTRKNLVAKISEKVFQSEKEFV